MESARDVKLWHGIKTRDNQTMVKIPMVLHKTPTSIIHLHKILTLHPQCRVGYHSSVIPLTISQVMAMYPTRASPLSWAIHQGITKTIPECSEPSLNNCLLSRDQQSKLADGLAATGHYDLCRNSAWNDKRAFCAPYYWHCIALVQFLYSIPG